MKIKTYRFAAAVAVLLALMVFMAPVGAVTVDGPGTYTVSTADELQSVLSQIESDTTPSGDYIVKLNVGEYILFTDSYGYIKITQTVGKNVEIEGSGIDQTVIIGSIYISGRSSPTTESLKITKLTINVSTSPSVPNDDGKVAIYSLPGGERYSHNVEISNIKIIGNAPTMDKDSVGFSGIHAASCAYNWVVRDVEVSDCTIGVGGYYKTDTSVDALLIENCIFNTLRGVNIQGTVDAVINIKNSEINAQKYAVRAGTSGAAFGSVTLENNILNSANEEDDATVIIRGSIKDDAEVKITDNVIKGEQNLLMEDATDSTYTLYPELLDLSNNYWGEDGNAPTSDELGGIVFAEDTPFYTELNEDGTINKNPTPSQPATPSSSSSGTPTPGAYYNYPRTVSDGGLVEFGTSKVVKSVTLPAGSSGKVNLHIDSTAYWPLSLDSEFTFDISVDNLGEGTSYISFKIAESKLTALELTAADVGVYHNVNGEWVKLVVTYTIEDGNVIYTAETDSFSPFKLVIEEGAAVQKEEVTPSEPVVDEPVIPDVPQDVPGEVLPEIPDVQDEPETPASPAPVLGLLAALGAAVVLRRK